MLVLVGFAFLGGIVTILSPCILPVLPIVLTGSVGSGKRRPLGIIAGFILSFTFFTLFLTAIVNVTGIPADAFRTVAVVILLLFGAVLLIPQLQAQIEKLMSRMTARQGQKTQRHGFWGGLIIGLSLGLLWTPCVGPILAAVISLALTGSVTGLALIITLAYALGTAIPMFVIMVGGRQLFQKVPGLTHNLARIQQAFGVLMIVTAVAIIFNFDRKLQTYVLEKLPNYGAGLTSIEDNDAVRSQLDSLNTNTNDDSIGKPMFDMNDEPTGPPAPEIIPGGEWFNSDPLTLASLEGTKVVLVDFWTYSCINCIRTLPYLNAWYDKYKDDGLEIIGVHTPEFEFEKDPDNVRDAMQEYGIEYPVVQDNDFATWRAYGNQYWPRKYLVDINGNIIYDHIGEGGYEETEMEIQKALEAVKRVDLPDTVVNPDNAYTLDPSVGTPELYFGAARNQYLGNGTRGQTGMQTLTVPNTVQSALYLGGTWDFQGEYAQTTEAGATIVLPYQAQNVYMVASADTPVTIRVMQGGKEVNIVTVSEEKLYTILENAQHTSDTLTIQVDEPGLKAFTFTFG